MKTYAKILTLILNSAFLVIIKGFVISKLWLWFIVSTFNTHELRIVESIGIMILFNFMTNNLDPSEKKYKEKNIWLVIAKSTGIVFISSAVLLSIAWVIHLFI